MVQELGPASDYVRSLRISQASWRLVLYQSKSATYVRSHVLDISMPGLGWLDFRSPPPRYIYERTNGFSRNDYSA